MIADENSLSTADSRRELWKTTLIVASSVAFGGLAIALWNRRELSDMRNQKLEPVRDYPRPRSSVDEEAC